MMTAAPVPLLAVDDLSLSFSGPAGRHRVIDRVSFTLARGEVFGLVGESGCGKSVTALSIAGLVKTPPGRFEGGAIRLDGEDLLTMPPAPRRAIRGRRVAMIFQEPMTSLNPVFPVGRQIAEVFETHLGLPRRQAAARAIDALAMVQIPAPARRAADYPHQLSGGMRQRVMIAMALACHPDLLIADEPTTALDVTVQAQIIDLMHRLREDLGTSILFISHDLALVAEFAERIAVMYAGQIIEQGHAHDVLTAPVHPYTQGLLRAMPRLGQRLVHGRQPLPEISGNVPQPSEWTSACRFASRCPSAMAACRQDLPLFRGDLPGRARCVLDAGAVMECTA